MNCKVVLISNNKKCFNERTCTIHQSYCFIKAQWIRFDRKVKSAWNKVFFWVQLCLRVVQYIVCVCACDLSENCLQIFCICFDTILKNHLHRLKLNSFHDINCVILLRLFNKRIVLFLNCLYLHKSMYEYEQKHK